VQKIHAHLALTPKGWVRDLCIEIEDSRVAQVSYELPKEHYSVDLLLPAPVNLHSHAFQRALAGLTETRGPNPQDSFWTWRKLMFQFLDRLTPDQVQAIAELVFMEMLEAGYGAVAEFHYCTMISVDRNIPIYPRWPKGSRQQLRTQGLG